LPRDSPLPTGCGSLLNTVGAAIKKGMTTIAEFKLPPRPHADTRGRCAAAGRCCAASRGRKAMTD
jgi:hypothetical protein